MSSVIEFVKDAGYVSSAAKGAARGAQAGFIVGGPTAAALVYGANRRQGMDHQEAKKDVPIAAGMGMPAGAMLGVPVGAVGGIVKEYRKRRAKKRGDK